MNPNSESYWKLLKEYTPNGCQTLSKMPNRFVEGVYPKVLERGKGGHVTDVDGNSYIDLISGLGAISVGYANEQVTDAVYMQLMKGSLFSLPNILEYQTAKKLTELVPSTEQWKFFASGTEACMAGVKVARAYTGRDKVMACGYHGWADWYTILNEKKAGIPEVLQDYITKGSYNDIDSFMPLLSKEYAAVIMEPMVFDDPKDGFLEHLQTLCKETGTLLIFDEVVTGGRFKGFVAQDYLRIVPDITLLSKGAANGVNFASLGSTKSIMATFERDDFFVSGTFGGSCLALRACLETVNILEKSLDKMIWNGSRIKEAFNKVFMEAKCKGYPTRLTFDFPTKEHKALFMQEMCFNGVLIGYSNFIMADHTEKDVTDIIKAIFNTYTVMNKHWDNPGAALQGSMPVEVFRLR